MKYTSHLKQLSVDMFRSSFDKLDKNNRWVKLGDLLPMDGSVLKSVWFIFPFSVLPLSFYSFLSSF